MESRNEYYKFVSCYICGCTALAGDSEKTDTYKCGLCFDGVATGIKIDKN